MAALIGLTLTFALTGCDSSSSTYSVTKLAPEISSSPSSRPPLPDGWRWESYGGAEIGVPADWSHGTSNYPWCLAAQGGPDEPYVGRPGVVPSIGCVAVSGEDTFGTAQSAAKVGSFVWFSKQLGPEPKNLVPRILGDDRVSRVVAGIHIDVQAPAKLRTQILKTLHEVPTGRLPDLKVPADRLRDVTARSGA